jgi:hypothetical protein
VGRGADANLQGEIGAVPVFNEDESLSHLFYFFLLAL